MPKSKPSLWLRSSKHAAYSLVLTGIAAIACSHKADDCNYTLTCGTFNAIDAGGNTATDTGSSVGGVGGTTQSSTGGIGGTPENTAGGADSGVGGITSIGGTSTACASSCTGYTHCNESDKTCVCGDAGQCKTSTPYCNDLEQCVQCGDAGDCKSANAPICSDTFQCVECAQKQDCTDPIRRFCDSTHHCVACLGEGDCANGEHCNSANQCVECLTDDHCQDPAHSQCIGGTCQPCDRVTQPNDAGTDPNAHCKQFANANPETTICKPASDLDAGANPGTCVQCTIDTETEACGGNSCNPATNACTKTQQNSQSVCQPCVADSECSSTASATARCVPMNFGGSFHGTYCLQQVPRSNPCPQPYRATVTAISVSDAPSVTYCSPDESITTCEAVLNMMTTVCANDSECGQGGICRNIPGSGLTCTIQCSTNATCLASSPGATCADNGTGTLKYCQ